MADIRHICSKFKNLKRCNLSKKIVISERDIKQISTPIVKKILTNSFNNGSDMNAVVCLLDSIFSTSAQKDTKYPTYAKLDHEETCVPRLSVHVSKWVTRFEKINIESSSGFVYLSDILSEDIQIIIKVPQESHTYHETIQEYFIGITEINKLRYTVPNFVYTFGAFFCPRPENDKKCRGSKKSLIPFIIFEKIPGQNMEKMLHDDRLTFQQYLGMFIQVLLALEVAQREVSFGHFDFHTANLMCRPLEKECRYKVPLDNNVYEITAKEYLPIIIDFGLSTVTSDNIIIGSNNFPEHGMMSYMIPGVDMYKFLVYSCVFSKGDLQRQIINLLSFYGRDDPYKLLINGEDGFQTAIDAYVKKSSTSKIASITPLQFLDWIISQTEYSKITSQYIQKKVRNIYIPLSYSTIQTYNDIFENTKDINKTVKLIKRIRSSYVMTEYYLYTLRGYNDNLPSKIDTKHIYKILKKNKKHTIQNDMKMLFSYKDIPIPDIISIIDDSKRILNIKIPSKKVTKFKLNALKLIQRFFNSISFFNDILPYLQFMYTIKEINLEKIYNTFLISFISSTQYKTYVKYCNIINQTSRWSHTLLNSFK